MSSSSSRESAREREQVAEGRGRDSGKRGSRAAVSMTGGGRREHRTTSMPHMVELLDAARELRLRVQGHVVVFAASRPPERIPGRLAALHRPVGVHESAASATGEGECPPATEAPLDRSPPATTLSATLPSSRGGSPAAFSVALLAKFEPTEHRQRCRGRHPTLSRKPPPPPRSCTMRPVCRPETVSAAARSSHCASTFAGSRSCPYATCRTRFSRSLRFQDTKSCGCTAQWPSRGIVPHFSGRTAAHRSMICEGLSIFA